jgi:RND family efflux transporter MFP subunit
MKKIAVWISVILLSAACSPRNDRARLQQMESRRDELTREINRLREKMDLENPGSAEFSITQPVRIARVDPTLFRHFIRIQGTVESDNNILVSAQASGVVERILVRAGDRVAAGQLLAELDAAVLESNLAEVESGLDLARTIYERQSRLWQKKIGSEIEYLQAKNNLEGLERRLETLREQLRMTRVTAPIGGTVDEVFIKEGEMAAAGQGALRIVQLSRLKVTALLSENYISRVRRGDEVTVEIPVLGKSFARTVTAASQVIDPQTRTFQIEVRIPPEEKTLKPNLLAVVTINDYTNPEAVTVPVGIVQDSGDERFLFVAGKDGDGWRAHRRAVQIGQSQSGRLEILEGLEPGEYVVAFGFQNLADGQRISAEIEK